MADYTVKQLAKLTGVSVRTLHYYDEIGLLRPAAVTGAGYRLYNGDSVRRLQQILFFRELDFPLKAIAPILDHPAFDRRDALTRHRRLLELKRERLDGLIGLVDEILEEKGESFMSFGAFDMSEIEAARTAYGEEAESRWGGTAAYEESRRKTDGYSPADWQALSEEADAIFRAFADRMREGADPADPAVRQLVADWQAFITRGHYTCTNEILAGLGEMYTADERFTASIDRYGSGLAAFISAAIAAYCDS